MACGRDRLDAVAAEQEGEADADEAECRLRVLGEPQLVVVGGGEQPAQVDVGGRRSTCRRGRLSQGR